MSIRLIICILFIPIIAFAQPKDHHVYVLGNLCDEGSLSFIYERLDLEIDTEIPSTILINGDITSSSVSTISGEYEWNNFVEFVSHFKNQKNLKIVVLAGDRDWNDNNPEGLSAVQLLEEKMDKFIANNEFDNLKYLTTSGCPGPFTIDLNRYTKLIALNTQWWNHIYEKPLVFNSDCPYINNTDIINEIQNIISSSDNQNILIAGHHPILSNGNYGGRYSWKDNAFPYPFFSLIRNSYHANVGGSYDLANPRLKLFGDLLFDLLFYKNSMIYASSHEKNQQILSIEDNIFINSGNLTKGEFAPSSSNSLINSSKGGIIMIKYKKDGEVSSSFIPTYELKNTENTLFESACNPQDTSETEAIFNTSYIPCVLFSPSNDTLTGLDSIYRKIGYGYRSNIIERIFLGAHHRKIWNSEIAVPVLNINPRNYDFKPYAGEFTGQTNTLKFQDQEGRKYSFRSLDKKPERTLNYELRKSIIAKIFEDQTSSQFPLAPLLASKLAESLNILHTDPKLYVLPDTETLGPFQDVFGGSIGFLQKQVDSAALPDSFGVAEEVITSNTLFNKLFESEKAKVNHQAYIKNRLFDILIGDCGRSASDIKWIKYSNEESEEIYYPFSLNRDLAFSKWDGVFPWLADREWALRTIDGFDGDIESIESVMYRARHLDRFVLQEPNLNDFIRQASMIKNQLTDEKIIAAVNSLPPNIYRIEGEKLIKKLKQRRDKLEVYAKKYFEWLSEDVAITGSDDSDQFCVYEKNDSIVVEINKSNRWQHENNTVFRRVFHKDYTSQIRLYGLGGNDKIFADVNDNHGIHIKILGGEGEDEYSILHGKEIVIYDDAENTYSYDSLQTVGYNDTWEKQKYIYDRTGKKFDTYFPIFRLGFNSYNGFTGKIGNSWTLYRWDKPDFHQKHKLEINASSAGDYGLSYEGITRHFYKRLDFTYDLILANPEFFDSYYGQGNFTTLDPDLNAADFYLAEYNHYRLYLGMRYKFWDNSIFSFRTGYSFFINKNKKNTILENVDDLLGANERLSIIPVSTSLDLDFRDDKTFPKRGSRIQIIAYNGVISNRNYQQFGKVGGVFEQYFTTYNSMPFTFALRGGITKGFGRIPFYLQPRLGGNNYLRGYTSNRFFGRSLYFFNTEVRWRLLADKKASIPYEFGISGFYDIGKVSNYDGIYEEGSKYHKGYGFGIFIIPFDERFTLSAYMSFSEENTFYPQFTIGSAIN